MGTDLRQLDSTRPEDTGLGVRRTFERRYDPGEIIFEQGEPGSVLYVIQSGAVELVRPGAKRARVVARLGPGDLFGEMSVLLGAPRSVRAVATEPTRLLELDGGTFETMCLERPEIGLGVIRRLAARVIELEQRLAGLGIDELLRPLVRTLVRQAERGTASARVRTTLRELAGAAGLSMLDSHRALQSLFERKLLRLVDDALIIPDLDALEASLDGID